PVPPRVALPVVLSVSCSLPPRITRRIPSNHAPSLITPTPPSETYTLSLHDALPISDAQRRPYTDPGGEPRSGRLPDHRYLADPRLGARRPRAPGLRHRVASRLGPVHRGQAGPESRRTDRVERRRGAQGRRGARDPAPRVRGRRRSRAVLGGRDRG